MTGLCHLHLLRFDNSPCSLNILLLNQAAEDYIVDFNITIAAHICNELDACFGCLRRSRLSNACIRYFALDRDSSIEDYCQVGGGTLYGLMASRLCLRPFQFYSIQLQAALLFSMKPIIQQQAEQTDQGHPHVHASKIRIGNS